jgi:vancomycin resistance protein YoaR
MKKNIQIIFQIILTIVFTSAVYSGEKNLISSFSSSVADQDEDVKRNIHITAGKINGIIIKSGSVFSFNETAGEGSVANGYVNGRVLYTDGARMEPGGGICQVSSTLFNALLQAGCIIIERHRHHQPVTYVPLGLDATIKYGKKDLKIKNSNNFDIEIVADMNEKNLTISIQSASKNNFTWEIVTEEDETAVPVDKNFSGRIRQGITIFVYRKKFSGEKLLESQLLYKDYYPPVRYK